MRKEYVPLRDIRGNVSNGMNAPKQGRFGRVREAFARDSAYYGDRAEWYIVAARNRDSDVLERSNWDSMVALLGGEHDANDGKGVAIERANHWACGWVDYLLVSPSNRQALRLSIYAHSSLSRYPILDEEHYSELEDADCRQIWCDCFNAKDRLDYFRRHGFTSNGPASMLRAILRGDWYEAASMLNCPNELAHN